MKQIYIYGVPGTGKSTLAKATAKALGYQFVELDAVRPIAQAKVTKDQAPFLYEYTTEAWKQFGSLNYENVATSLKAIRQAFQPHIDLYLGQFDEDIIAEAVFVEPSASSILITNTNEESHYNNFFVHRKPGKDADLQFQAARLMQDFLIDEAKEKGVAIIENDSSVEQGVAEILNVISASTAY